LTINIKRGNISDKNARALPSKTQQGLKWPLTATRTESLAKQATGVASDINEFSLYVWSNQENKIKPINLFWLDAHTKRPV
jgi:hypothetical protein